MCIGSKPKVVQQAPAPAANPAKPPVYMRNPYLDGMGPNGEVMGRNSLRIEMGTAAARAPVSQPLTPWTPPVRMPQPVRRPGGPVTARPVLPRLPTTSPVYMAPTSSTPAPTTTQTAATPSRPSSGPVSIKTRVQTRER